MNDEPYFRYILDGLPNVSYSEYQLIKSRYKLTRYKVKKIIDDIKQAYLKYYQSDDHWKIIEPKPIPAFPTLLLVDRYLKKDINKRGGILKIIEPATIFSQRVLQNPQLLETTDQHSKIYLGACVNQPVAGFTEIANLANIDSCTTIPQKLEECRVLIALDLIKMNIGELKSIHNQTVGVGVEVELANAILIEVHKTLLMHEIIDKKWQAIPHSIAYSNTVADFITRHNIFKISDIVVEKALKIPLTEVVEFMYDKYFCDFWITQTITKEQRDEIMQPYTTMVTRLSDDDYEDIQNPDTETPSFEEQVEQMRKLEISCQEEMFKISKEITLENIPKSSVSTRATSMQSLLSSITKNSCTIS
jgi:hypothetical protein